MGELQDGVEVGVKEEQPSGKYVVRAAVLTSPSVAEEEQDADDARLKAVRSTLQIGDLRGTDSAKYTCRAENAHGIDEIAHVLEVVGNSIATFHVSTFPRCVVSFDARFSDASRH